MQMEKKALGQSKVFINLLLRQFGEILGVIGNDSFF